MYDPFSDRLKMFRQNCVEQIKKEPEDSFKEGYFSFKAGFLHFAVGKKRYPEQKTVPAKEFSVTGPFPVI